MVAGGAHVKTHYVIVHGKDPGIDDIAYISDDEKDVRDYFERYGLPEDHIYKLVRVD